MSIHKMRDGVFEVRWREGGRNKCTWVHGSHELAKKIERKKMSARDENRHLDVKREINFRMSALIDRYTAEYSSKKKSAEREVSILDRIASRAWPSLRSGSGRARRPAMVPRIDGRGSLPWYGGTALQRHAPHDEEGLYDLVKGNRHRAESGGSSRSLSAG